MCFDTLYLAKKEKMSSLGKLSDKNFKKMAIFALLDV